MTTNPQTDETARALLWRHGLPEDIVDGALCLHAQELAALQRLRMDELDLTGQKARIVGRIVDLIDPTKTPAVSVPAPAPTDQAAVEGAVDRLAQWLWDNCAEDERSGLLADDPRRIATVALHWPELRRAAAASGSGRVADKTQAEAQACTEFGTWFDRSICPDPCGAMHQRCDACGAAIGGCANDAVVSQPDGEA